MRPTPAEKNKEELTILEEQKSGSPKISNHSKRENLRQESFWAVGVAIVVCNN